MSRTRTFLAFDLGATSGRAILGHYGEDSITIKEVHRFPNDPVRYTGELHWDAPRLWLEMRRALQAVSRYTDRLDGIGVDAWGVDYALLGEHGTLLENPYHYRDARTEGVMEQVFQRVPRQTVYNETGVQFMEFNTLFQLSAAMQRTPRLLEHAQSLVTMPDLFHYWLTGVAVCEYTVASTTQMLSHKTKAWASDLLRQLGLPTHLLCPIVAPGTPLGKLIPELAASPALAAATLIAPACHDTGSAVAAVHGGSGTAFLSSGTWSLLGMEVPQPIVTPEAHELNFTNEGGVGNTIRLLKNITGLWLLEGCRKAWQSAGETWSHEQLIAAAAGATPLQHLIDPDAADFVRPASMPEAIRGVCARTGQPSPATPGAYARAVMESLALKYRLVLEQLESITGNRIEQIRMIGGGSQNALLNQFTADATDRRVLAGPAEATALGNIAVQIVGTGVVGSFAAARDVLARSFPAATFEPKPDKAWDEAYQLFQHICR